MYCLEEALFLKELSHCLCVHYGRRQFSTSMPVFQIMCIIIYFMHTTHIGHHVYNNDGNFSFHSEFRLELQRNILNSIQNITLHGLCARRLCDNTFKGSFSQPIFSNYIVAIFDKTACHVMEMRVEQV